MSSLNDEVMKVMASVALESALQKIAETAKSAAEVCPPGLSGHDALIAFADAILETNAETWPTTGKAS